MCVAHTHTHIRSFGLDKFPRPLMLQFTAVARKAANQLDQA